MRALGTQAILGALIAALTMLVPQRASAQAGTCRYCYATMDGCGFWTSGYIDCIIRCQDGFCNCGGLGSCGDGGGDRIDGASLKTSDGAVFAVIYRLSVTPPSEATRSVGGGTLDLSTLSQRISSALGIPSAGLSLAGLVAGLGAFRSPVDYTLPEGGTITLSVSLGDSDANSVVSLGGRGGAVVAYSGAFPHGADDLILVPFNSSGREYVLVARVSVAQAATREQLSNLQRDLVREFRAYAGPAIWR